MRTINLIMLMLVFNQLEIMAQSPPYLGGNGSGHSVSNTPPTFCFPFAGGDGDGTEALLLTSAPCNNFLGGTQDGAAYGFSPFSFCPQFPGGTGDGFAVDSSGCFTVLPVRRFIFYGEHEETRNILHWKAETGYAIKEFEVEKSDKGVSFIKMGTVSGSPDQSHIYTYVDNTPYPEISFYRVKITELNGQISYSNILVLKGNSSSSFTVYPNPNRGISTVYFYAKASLTTTLQLFDISGKRLAGIPIRLNKGSNYISLDMSRYLPGLYLLKVNDEAITIIRQK